MPGITPSDSHMLSKCLDTELYVQLLKDFFKLHLFVCVYTCTSVWARHHIFVEFRGQLSEGQFSSIMFVLGSNLTFQAWHQVILYTMPSGLTKRYVLRNRNKYLLYHTNIPVCACVRAHLYCRIICFTIFLFWECL